MPGADKNPAIYISKAWCLEIINGLLMPGSRIFVKNIEIG